MGVTQDKLFSVTNEREESCPRICDLVNATRHKCMIKLGSAPIAIQWSTILKPKQKEQIQLLVKDDYRNGNMFNSSDISEKWN